MVTEKAVSLKCHEKEGKFMYMLLRCFVCGKSKWLF